MVTTVSASQTANREIPGGDRVYGLDEARLQGTTLSPSRFYW